MRANVPASRPRGFSIVEALVALVVLSIGMLGIAALYVESLRAGRSAIYRTQAVNLATDMADRIRANRLAGSDYRLLAGATPPTAPGCAPPTPIVCTRTQLAQDDVARWLQAISTALPGTAAGGTPAGTITVTGVPPAAQYSIQVSWSEPGENQPLTYVLNMQI